MYKVILRCIAKALAHLIRNIPSAWGGVWIRNKYYHFIFKSMGTKCAILEGIIFYGGFNIKCGSNVTFGRNSIIQGSGGLVLGNNIIMGPSCFIWTVNHDYTVTNIVLDKKYHAKPVIIEDNVWLGANIKITPGTRIGTGCVIGMGSVVTKDIAPYSLVAGNPATLIKRLHPTEKVHKNTPR